MSSINIYDILSTKPHNPHYLKRYVKFIEWCFDNPHDGYTEFHHICPKATDMFPEFVDFSFHAWNAVQLSARQHIVAHILLWKTYRNPSQTAAIYYMLNVQNSNTKFNQRNVPLAIQIRYAAKVREEFYKNREGYAVYKDENGNKYFLHNTDEKIQELDLVGNNFGYEHSAEAKERMSNAKLPNREVTMTFLDLTRRIKLFSDEYDAHIAQGWRPLLPRGTSEKYRLDIEDVLYRRELAGQQKSIETKGTANYWWPDGTPYGSRLSHNDPLIEELGLVIITTDAKIEAARRNSKLANQANQGTQWYNNGIINKKFKSDPGGEWVLGQKPFAEGALDFRKQRSSEAGKGTKTYNDGVRNYRITDGDYIDPSWKPGMAPQKERKSSQVPGSKIYNNGVNNIRVNPGDYIDPSWKPGMVKGVKKKMRYTNGIDIIDIMSGDPIPDGYKRATKEQIDKLTHV